MAQEANVVQKPSGGNWRDAVFDIMSGTMGGIAQVAIGHPLALKHVLDTVKVRLQTTGQFGGMMDTFGKTVRHEVREKWFALRGIQGLYKGAASPLAGAVLHNAILFFTLGRFRNTFADANGETYGWRTFAAGMATGLVASILEGPIDLFKCKMQAQIGSGQYKGVLDCVIQIFKQTGIRGAYQGITPTILRNMPGFGSYFWASQTVNDALTPKGELPTLSTVFLGGAAAGACFWGLWYPIELVKTRMQAAVVVTTTLTTASHYVQQTKRKRANH